MIAAAWLCQPATRSESAAGSMIPARAAVIASPRQGCAVAPLGYCQSMTPAATSLQRRVLGRFARAQRGQTNMTSEPTGGAGYSDSDKREDVKVLHSMG